MKILIADNMPFFVNGLKNLLESLPNYEVIEVMNRLDDVLAKCRDLSPDLVILRSFLFYQNTAFAASQLIKENYPSIKVIINLEFEKAALVEEAKLHMADSCIFSSAQPKEFVSCIQKTYEGENVFPFIDDNKWGPWRAHLTDRELDTIRLICCNLTYEEMSQELNVSKRTISFHVSNILSKTGHKNITGLVLEAAHKGYLTSWKN